MPQARDSRSRRLVSQLLGQFTYPEGLGLDVTREEDWFPWFVAASIFAKPISANVARKTAWLLLKEGLRTPEAIRRCGWDGLVALLDLGGYVRYDFSTADKLLLIAGALQRNRLGRLRTEASSMEEIERELTRIPGVGPKTVQIFLRELRGMWPIDMPVGEEARSAARRLRLPVKAAGFTGHDLSRLESVLTRTWVEHCKRGRWQACPAGEFCGCRG